MEGWGHGLWGPLGWKTVLGCLFSWTHEIPVALLGIYDSGGSSDSACNFSTHPLVISDVDFVDIGSSGTVQPDPEGSTNDRTDPKMSPQFLGEFEQMVLLAILQGREEAYAISILKELDRRAGRKVSRGALYKTLERMETKGLVRWKLEEGTPERGGHPRRSFQVTDRGIASLQESRQAWLRLWDGLEGVLEDGG